MPLKLCPFCENVTGGSDDGQPPVYGNYCNSTCRKADNAASSSVRLTEILSDNRIDVNDQVESRQATYFQGNEVRTGYDTQAEHARAQYVSKF